MLQLVQALVWDCTSLLVLPIILLYIAFRNVLVWKRTKDLAAELAVLDVELGISCLNCNHFPVLIVLYNIQVENSWIFIKLYLAEDLK